MAKTDPLPTFALNFEQAQLYDELMDDMQELGANCVDQLPSQWVDYGEEGDPFPEPTSVDAALMCSGCPVVEGCFEFAKKFRPNHGVWGGVKFRSRMGKI